MNVIPMSPNARSGAIEHSFGPNGAKSMLSSQFDLLTMPIMLKMIVLTKNQPI